MSNQASVTSTINIVPVQGIFQPAPTFDLITLIGPAGTPFYASISPNQSGLNITNSTINSTTIGATVPSTGAFSAGTVIAAPTGATDLVNKQYVDYYAAGLSWKAPVTVASTVNIPTLSGLLTVDTVTLVAGETVLVKNQTNAADNGIYVVSAGAWTRSVGADVWEEFIGAIVFVVEGTQTGSAWFCTAQPGGTLGVTALNWSNFSVASTYTAGTGLTLAGTQFSITPVGAAGTYGSASSVPVFVTNASGQVTSVTNTAIAIANTAVSGLGTMSTQNANTVAITGGTLDAVTIGGTTAGAITGTTITANTQFSGAGTGLTGTASGLSIGGNAATATSATTATNLAGGGAGSLPYQSATATTAMLAAGSNGQVLTLASGVPSWATPTTGTVTSVGTAGTVNGLTLTGGPITTSGTITLGGTLDLSAPPTIGNTTANTGAFTTLSGSTSVTTPIVQATNSGGLVLRNSAGTTQIGMGAGGGDNVSINVSTNINGTNAQIDISPTGTGHVHIKPTGVNSVEIAPTSIGTINNMSIGATTAAAAKVTTLDITSTLALAGSTGTAGYVLTSNGASAPTWQANASGLAITDDTTTNATRFLTFTSASTGSITGADVSSTKLSFNPSTGAFTATSLTPTNALGVPYGGSGAITLTGILKGNGTSAFTAATAGTDYVAPGTATTFTALQTFAGTSSNADMKTSNILEVATISATAATGTINYDMTTQSVLYYTTDASGNFTVNFRGSSGTSLNTIMATGESLSATFLVTNGATAYYNSAVQVDGSSVTPKWQGGTAPTSGNASSIDSYTYVIIKTGSATFTVLASVTKFA
jgi:hypothetical protein